MESTSHDILIALGIALVAATAYELFRFVIVTYERRLAEQVIGDGLHAAMTQGLLDTILAQPTLPELTFAQGPEMWASRLPETAHPGTWQGTGVAHAGDPHAARRSNVARFEDGKIGDAPAIDKPPTSTAPVSSVAVRGRIAQRQLITLTCVRCGADLLPHLPVILTSGCACHAAPAAPRRVW